MSHKAVESNARETEEAPLCPNCIQPITDMDDFCPHCGAPASALSTIDPFLRTRTCGYVMAKAAGGESARDGALLKVFCVLMLMALAIVLLSVLR